MNKNFTKEKLLSFTEKKQVKILYDLARLLELQNQDIKSNNFLKLAKYHKYLELSSGKNILKLNKEFSKIKLITDDYQFQLYLMLLERLHGQSLKEYDFLVETKDKDLPKAKTIPVTIILDSIRSAHNIGAILRNVECFGLEKIIMTGLSPTPEHEQVKKTSMGSHNNVQWSYEKEAINYIKEKKKNGIKVYAIETGKNAININKVQSLDINCLIIFGHEQFGISYEILKECDEVFFIPMYGQKNSLNVSVSSGIIFNRIRSLIPL